MRSGGLDRSVCLSLHFPLRLMVLVVVVEILDQT